jgi:hypothetical protein
MVDLDNKDVLLWAISAAIFGLVFFVHCAPRRERYEEGFEEGFEEGYQEE